ncbi:hypothetical protein HOD20_07315 [archaeon]|nr:hypothetical protein [archaeon]
MIDLKKEVEGYKKAKQTLDIVGEKVLSMLNGVEKSVDEQNKLVLAIKEIDTGKIIDEQEVSKNLIIDGQVETKKIFVDNLEGLEIIIYENNEKLEKKILEVKSEFENLNTEIKKEFKGINSNVQIILKWGKIYMFLIPAMLLILGLLLFITK